MQSGNEDTEHKKRDFIHQAQISVMVTGIDDWFWTAYCFVDTYFKSVGHSESAQHFSDLGWANDPFSCGKYAINRPIWTPRHYFLQVLSCRMEQVKQEWNNSVSRLFNLIDPYVCPLLNILNCMSSLTS